MSAYSDAILMDTPVGYWRLGETGGLVAKDSSGHGYDGAINPTGVTLGAPGALITDSDTAMIFDGSTGTVTVPYFPALHPGDVFSVEFWAASYNGNVGGGFFDNSGAGADISILGGGANPGVMKCTAQGSSIMQYGVIPYNDGTGLFHHWVWTKNGAANALYRDAVDVTAQSSLTNVTIVPSTGPTYFAFRAAGSHTNIGMDEIALYSYSLSAGQVMTHFRAAAIWQVVGTAKARSMVASLIGRQ